MLRRLLLPLLLVLPLSASAETLTGKVVGVTDGDTIKVLVEERIFKVRLAEIDTPERGQPWAKRAKQALSDKVFGHEVEIRVVTVDRYGRTVGHVWLADRHINRELVREGHAWVYRSYLKDKTLLDAESHAQANRLGLWKLPEAARIAPREWLRGQRNSRLKSKSPPPQDSSCGAKRKCRKMTSCEEARFYLEKCGLKGLDGDRDGVPCEALCR
jgi:endonuclease YncB( thermonuclease family)